MIRRVPEPVHGLVRAEQAQLATRQPFDVEAVGSEPLDLAPQALILLYQGDRPLAELLAIGVQAQQMGDAVWAQETRRRDPDDREPEACRE
jgi:hypothetical protein